MHQSIATFTQTSAANITRRISNSISASIGYQNRSPESVHIRGRQSHHLKTMASSKLLFILSLVFIHFIALSTVAQLKEQYHNCYPNAGNYTTNSPYEANLNHLLNSLSTDTGIDNGFYDFSYGENPDSVYAIGICRPDMDTESCRNCLSVASSFLTSTCPNFLMAIAWLDDGGFNNCMLRYANYGISGLMEAAPYFLRYSQSNISENLVEFDQTRNRSLERLISKAASSDSRNKYAVGEEIVTGNLSLYALVQCNPDLSRAVCNLCLYSILKNVADICDTKDGGGINSPSCSFRYEKSKFYKSSIEGTPPPYPKGKKNVAIIVVCSVIGSMILMLFIGCSIFFRMRKTEEDYENMEEIQNRESLQFKFSTIRDATDNFSDANKLGQGGFGAVYKGMLSNGQQIAVKRLSMNSKQGDLEFKTEVLLVAKLQHRNLVRLLGFCLERKERILVYEFLPKSSLNHFLFDPIKRECLDWEKRYKIIGGIARGLLYLHEDSRLRIIHRDLKTSNVLLDSELNPKISDFGMATLFEMDHTQSDSSNRVVGTFGYMAPEYVMNGHISVKSDVYSYGTLVLEIMSGQKINSFGTEDETEGLLSYAWKNWNEGTASNLIDPTLKEGSRDEMMKCIHIGLLCVQENVSDRPTMASVVAYLNSTENRTLQAPSKPGFLLQISIIREASSAPREYYSGSTKSDQVKNEVVPLSRNDVTITELYPR